MKEKNEPATVRIKGITFENVTLDGMGPLEVHALAAEITNRMDEISAETGKVTTWELLGRAALYYAALARGRANSAKAKTQDEDKMLDKAIEALTDCLNSLPLK